MQTTAPSPKTKSNKAEQTRINIRLNPSESISGTMLRQSDKCCTASFESMPKLAKGQQVEIECGRNLQTACCTETRNERGQYQADFEYIGGKK
jgi:hypothetical protein